jgi:hypothetical protein
LKKELTKDFYKQTDNTYILNKEGTGEKITEINIQKTNLNDTKKQELTEKTRKKQTEINKKEGLETKFKDESGKKITTTEGRILQKGKLEKLEEKIADKAIEKTKKKSATRPDNNMSYLNERIAAKRKSKEIIEEKIHSHDILKAA